MRKLLCVVLAAGAIASAPAAQERVNRDVYWTIRQEATTNSQVLRTVHMLTDLYGSRLTGSPSLKAAGEWVIQQMHAWGLRNGRLEPWDFSAAYGRTGWTNDRLSAHIVSPVRDALVVEALAVPAAAWVVHPVVGGVSHNRHSVNLRAAGADRSFIVPMRPGELAPFRASKGTLRFPLSEPVPVTLIDRIARFRVKSVMRRAKAKLA